jgi:hypothetical protein
MVYKAVMQGTRAQVFSGVGNSKQNELERVPQVQRAAILTSPAYGAKSKGFFSEEKKFFFLCTFLWVMCKHRPFILTM